MRVVQPSIGHRTAYLAQQRRAIERPGAGPRHNVLGQHIEPAGTKCLAVALAFVDRLLGRHRLEKFKAVARYQQGPAGRIEPVIGPPDPLQQPRAALGRAHLHDQINIAPIDPQIEAGGSDQRAQLAARHRAFDFAPRLLRQRAMMNPDRQVIRIGFPQLLKNELGQKARVAEDQRRVVGADRFDQLRHCPSRGMPAPRHPGILGQQDRELGRRAGFTQYQRDATQIAMRCQPAFERGRIGQRRRQGDPLQRGRKRLQPGQREREQVTAFGRRERVHLVDHNPLQSSKQRVSLGIGEQQRERFRRGQQHMRRAHPLPRFTIRRSIAAAGLDPHVQAQLGHRGQQIALHIVRQRLQRRNVERVQAIGRRAAVQLRRTEGRQCWQKPAQSLARAGIGHQQRVLAARRHLQHLALMPPQLPAAGSKPLAEFRGEQCGRHGGTMA